MTLRSLGQYFSVFFPSNCFGRGTSALLQKALLALFSTWSSRSLNSNSQNCYYFNNMVRLPGCEVSSNAAALRRQLLARQEGETVNPGGHSEFVCKMWICNLAIHGKSTAIVFSFHEHSHCLCTEAAALLLFHPTWFLTEGQAQTHWVLLAAYTNRKCHFFRLLEKMLGSAKLLFAVRQGFNNLFSGRRLGS